MNIIDILLRGRNEVGPGAKQAEAEVARMARGIETGIEPANMALRRSEQQVHAVGGALQALIRGDIGGLTGLALGWGKVGAAIASAGMVVGTFVAAYKAGLMAANGLWKLFYDGILTGADKQRKALVQMADMNAKAWVQAAKDASTAIDKIDAKFAATEARIAAAQGREQRAGRAGEALEGAQRVRPPENLAPPTPVLAKERAAAAAAGAYDELATERSQIRDRQERLQEERAAIQAELDRLKHQRDLAGAAYQSATGQPAGAMARLAGAAAETSKLYREAQEKAAPKLAALAEQEAADQVRVQEINAKRAQTRQDQAARVAENRRQIAESSQGAKQDAADQVKRDREEWRQRQKDQQAIRDKALQERADMWTRGEAVHAEIGKLKDEAAVRALDLSGAGHRKAAADAQEQLDAIVIGRDARRAAREKGQSEERAAAHLDELRGRIARGTRLGPDAMAALQADDLAKKIAKEQDQATTDEENEAKLRAFNETRDRKAILTALQNEETMLRQLLTMKNAA